VNWEKLRKKRKISRKKSSEQKNKKNQKGQREEAKRKIILEPSNGRTWLCEKEKQRGV